MSSQANWSKQQVPGQPGVTLRYTITKTNKKTLNKVSKQVFSSNTSLRTENYVFLFTFLMMPPNDLPLNPTTNSPNPVISHPTQISTNLQGWMLNHFFLIGDGVVFLGKKLLWRNTFISINSLKKPVVYSGHRTFPDHGSTHISSPYKSPSRKARREKSKLRSGDRKKALLV